MTARLWKTSDDGLIEYVSLCAEQLESALDVMRNAFFLHENVCRAVGLPDDIEGQKELEDLCINTAQDGVSIIAIDRSTGKVVGTAFNKLQVNTGDEGSKYFKEFASKCKSSASRGVLEYMLEADNSYDLFEYCKVDCLLEIMFLGTLPQYRSQRIATTLCEISIRLGRTLLCGENIKTSLTNEELPLEPRPKLVSAIFTAINSQKIGQRLGFRCAVELSYKNFFFNGKSFASILGPDAPPSATLEYKLL